MTPDPPRRGSCPHLSGSPHSRHSTGNLRSKYRPTLISTYLLNLFICLSIDPSMLLDIYLSIYRYRPRDNILMAGTMDLATVTATQLGHSHHRGHSRAASVRPRSGQLVYVYHQKVLCKQFYKINCSLTSYSICLQRPAEVRWRHGAGVQPRCLPTSRRPHVGGGEEGLLSAEVRPPDSLPGTWYRTSPTFCLHSHTAKMWSGPQV